MESSCASCLLVFVLFVANTDAQSLRDRIYAAEDARAATEAELAPILTGIRQRDPAILVQAVRALGRLERPALVKQILPLLTHPRPDVRAEAANALGQALAAVPRRAESSDENAPPQDPPPAELADVAGALAARVRAESDPYAAGVAAETLGRLPYRTATAVADAEHTIAMLLPAAPRRDSGRPEPESKGGDRPVQPASLTGAVKGLEALIRMHGRLQPPDRSTIARLRAAAALEADPADGDLAFVRRLAWMAIGAAGGADVSLIERGLDDPDPQVRRLAVLTLGAMSGVDAERPALVARALRDQSFVVRYDAVRVYSRTLQAESCAPLLAAVDDRNVHVALAAIDALGNGCPAGPDPVGRLAGIVDELGDADGTTWHRPAHAFVSFARVARERATPHLARFAEHPTWQVRMYAARAAAAMMAAARLERLASSDPNDNVREAAIDGLIRIRRHDADAIYISALGRPDYQLVLTAVRALEATPDTAQAVPALLAAFRRITAEGRDTSRDPRVAILVRLRELGSRDHAAALLPCLNDADPKVAAECVATLQAWTGQPLRAAPAQPHTRKPDAARVVMEPIPTATRARVTMRRGGFFDLRLFPEETPATVARFVRLARQGYYHGLTFHRVVPNFVIQGGSPGANEYMGDGPFMRDELGLRSNRRGTLGISTRGRDTGDAQVFVNLLDNPRLDHNFTVFAEVVAGLDVVDGIVEGDVIDRIEISAAGERTYQIGDTVT